MSRAGIPDDVADRAYKFTQTAWGRVFLDDMGINFSSDYTCYNEDGDEIESGELNEQPYFAAAMRLVSRYNRTKGFLTLAVMSADVNAVNAALNAGAKPEDLSMGPAMLFVKTAKRREREEE